VTEVRDETAEAWHRGNLRSRLLRGAKVLGELWRSGARCAAEWSAVCPCDPQGIFCRAKERWVKIYGELNGEEEVAQLRRDGGRFGLLLAMTVRQFEATGLTLLVEVPGGEEPIRVGAKGTSWETLLDLAALRSTPDYTAALGAVLKIQLAERLSKNPRGRCR
jgi:hypothetical protein